MVNKSFFLLQLVPESLHLVAGDGIKFGVQSTDHLQDINHTSSVAMVTVIYLGIQTSHHGNIFHHSNLGSHCNKLSNQ